MLGLHGILAKCISIDFQKTSRAKSPSTALKVSLDILYLSASCCLPLLVDCSQMTAQREKESSICRLGFLSQLKLVPRETEAPQWIL